MTRTEAKQAGLNLISNWQVLWVLVGFIFVAGGSFAITQKNIVDNSNKIEKLETWKTDHIDEVGVIRMQIQRQNDEIQLNLKVLMESQGLKYQTIK